MERSGKVNDKDIKNIMKEHEKRITGMENFQQAFSKKALNTFLEKTFEIAFGDDAINKSYTMKEVVDRLREFSDNSLVVEENDLDKKENNMWGV